MRFRRSLRLGIGIVVALPGCDKPVAPDFELN
jgi:hypothetical protein